MPHDVIRDTRTPPLILVLCAVCMLGTSGSATQVGSSTPAEPEAHQASAAALAGAESADTRPRLLPLEEFSPAFLGIYRKVMEIEDEIRMHAEKYGVDPDLARAVCLYESGGNPDLTSWAGARGYFQVMPATFRALRVRTNIEAGVKYLAQLVRQFGREDYALAAYNGGPGRVSRRRPMPLESLQYVLGVGYYRTLLRMYDASIREHAQRLQLEKVRDGDTWWSLSGRLGIPMVQLRLHNPFLANRALRVGQAVAYPPEPRTDLFAGSDGTHLEYRTRHGDNYFNLAFTMDVDLDVLRELNGLWHLQTLPPGMTLKLPLERDGKYNEYRVRPGETLQAIADRMNLDPWRLIRDNSLWDEQVQEGMVLRVRAAPPRPAYLVHRVTNGDTLGGIARRYGTSVSAIQVANQMGTRTVIRVGDRLRIPTETN